LKVIDALELKLHAQPAHSWAGAQLDTKADDDKRRC
jgi:hypothetical protein